MDKIANKCNIKVLTPALTPQQMTIIYLIAMIYNTASNYVSSHLCFPQHTPLVYNRIQKPGVHSCESC